MTSIWNEGTKANAVVRQAHRGGLRVELDSGQRGWIRRNDLPAALRSREPEHLVGRSMTGLVMGVDPQGRGMLVSPRHLAYARFRAALDSAERLDGRVVGANRGGLLVEVDGLRGFLPRNELLRRERADHRALVGRSWRGWVLSVKADETLLSSQSPWRQRRRERRRRRFLGRLEVGQRRRGRVHVAILGGVIVRLQRDGVDALVPIDGARRAGREPPAEGQSVRVRITSIRPGGRHGGPAIRGSLDGR